MKKILVVAAMLLLAPLQANAAAGVWADLGAPIGPYSRSFVCAQAGVTCDAPTLATEGVQLQGVGGVVVTVCATVVGKTLSGAGTLTAYVYNVATATWAPAPDYNLTVTATGRCQSFAPFWVADQHGRIAWVTTVVTANDNSLTVYHYVSAPGGSPL